MRSLALFTPAARGQLLAGAGRGAALGRGRSGPAGRPAAGRRSPRGCRARAPSQGTGPGSPVGRGPGPSATRRGHASPESSERRSSTLGARGAGRSDRSEDRRPVRADSDLTLGVCERENKLSGPRPSTGDRSRRDRHRGRGGCGQGGPQPAGVDPPEVVLPPVDERHRDLLAVGPGQRARRPGPAVMSTSSKDSPSSAQTCSTTARASSQRWHPGLA